MFLIQTHFWNYFVFDKLKFFNTTLRFWTSYGLQAQVCTVGSTNIPLSCILLNDIDSPGPVTIDINTADSQPFKVSKSSLLTNIFATFEKFSFPSTWSDLIKSMVASSFWMIFITMDIFVMKKFLLRLLQRLTFMTCLLFVHFQSQKNIFFRIH